MIRGPMHIITTTDELAAFCRTAAERPYVTIDTEFLRERTYWAKLCLVQMALPAADGTPDGEAVLIDPIAGKLSFEPLHELFRNPSVVKVFHAGRQDLEIFFVEGGVIPAPLFDTQVAAMVCGFGEQTGYEKLARRLAHVKIDKSSRFTNWERRPLSAAQKKYALADVTHLRVIYEALAAQLKKSGREAWIAEELATLGDPATYETRPEDAWRRIRTRGRSGRFLAVVKELARFRETHAQKNDIPRSRVMKDDALLELASTRPQTPEELGKARLLFRQGRKPDVAEAILAAIRAGMEAPLPDADDAEARPHHAHVHGALAELLRVLLKAKSESLDVAPSLIASSADLDALAAGERDVALLRGWRREVFGEDALRLCGGEIALAADGQALRVIDVTKTDAAEGESRARARAAAPG